MLLNLTETYLSKQRDRELDLPDMPKSTALQRFLQHHYSEEDNLESYEIQLIDNLQLKFTQKETKKTYWVQLVHDKDMPCDPESCRHTIFFLLLKVLKMV